MRIFVLLSLFLSFGSLPSWAVEPGSQLIECDRADEPITLEESSHLDPSCTWTKGIRITASDVTLDCQGATIASTSVRYGVHIVAPTDVPLSGVRVRNCHIEGFLNCLHIEREGFRTLPEGEEYEAPFSDIVVEDSSMRDSRGVGVYVNGYVTGVTLRRLHVEGTGSSGIYLETGSTGTIVEDSVLRENGWRENGPGGQFFELGGLSFWYWGPGREGVAIDGSRFNVIRNNRFESNFSGGVLLYKNCGEYPESPRYFERRYGSHENLIEGNVFEGEENGVWIASRMGENTTPMNCTDVPYAPGYVLDHADDNVVRGNEFHDTVYGVRIEDDRATVEDNRFVSDDPRHVAVLVGTPVRASVLGLPVLDARITGNRAEIAGSKNPYRWIHDHVGTEFEDNGSFGRPVGLCEGVPAARGPFVMTTGVVPAPGGVPPDVEQPPLPHPDPLDPCPTVCETGAVASKVRLIVRRLGGNPGDDRLTYRARLALAAPLVPELDPVETGVGFVVENAHGERVVDVSIPGGAYDAARKEGWKRLRSRSGWRYTNRNDDAPGGVYDVLVHDLSHRGDGSVQVRVRARGGTYAVSPDDLPWAATVSLDPPTAETGQCARLSFDDDCGLKPGRLVCRTR